MPAPTISAIVPPSAVLGSPNTPIAVYGTSFASGMTINVNGVPLTTVYVSSTEATATIPSASLVSGGALSITATVTAQTSSAISFVVTSPLDLITLAQVKALLSADGQSSTNTSDDANIELAIQGWSAYFLKATGMSNGGLDTVSPFVQTVAYNEWYNGHGNNQLFVRHPPIQSITSLTGGLCAIGPSAGVNQYGYIVSPDQKSIYLRSAGWGPQFRWAYGLIGAGSRGFPRGIMNVNVQYVGGYPVTPFDIQEYSTIVVAQTWKRHSQNLDQKSKIMQAFGQTTFRDWIMPPECLAMVRSYTRVAG